MEIRKNNGTEVVGRQPVCTDAKTQRWRGTGVHRTRFLLLFVFIFQTELLWLTTSDLIMWHPA